MGYKLSDFSPSVQRRILADNAPQPVRAVAQPSKVKGVQNGAEKDFYVSHLQPRLQGGEFESVHYEGFTLPLAHRCTYTPDFDVRTRDGVQSFYEVKAPHRFKEKGILKLKFAAQTYPEAEFYLAEKKKGSWKVSRIPRLTVPPNLLPLDETDE